MIRRLSHVIALSLSATLVTTGCSIAPPGSFASTQPGPNAESREPTLTGLFAPTPPTNGFDPQRARLSLAEIPDNPTAPKATGQRPEPELPRQALRHMTEARRLFGEQRYSETVAEAEKALRYNDEVVEAHRLVAIASLFLGKTTEAKASADAVIALEPDDLPCRFIEGRLAEKADLPEAALVEYRTALKCPVQTGEESYLTLTHYYLGLLLHQQGYYSAAVEQLNAFEAAVARGGVEAGNPELGSIMRTKRTEPLLALADSHEALGQYDSAADALAAALQQTPESTVIQVRYIKDLVRAKRFDQAQKQADQYAQARKDLKSVELLVAVHEAGGRPNEATAVLEKLITQSPEQTDLGMFYADRLIAAKQFDQAVRVLNDLTQRMQDAAPARWKLISIHREQGNHQAWLWAMGAQLGADPTDMARALAELTQMDKDAAAQAIDQALGRNAAAESQPAQSTEATTVAGYYFCLGKLADRLDRVDDAQTLYEKSLRAKPEFIAARVGMAEMWTARCKWENALAALKDAGSVNAAWQANLERIQGQCYDGLDDFPQALEHYKAAIKKAPQGTETLLLMGRLLERFQQFDEAAKAFRAIIDADPDRADARELLIMNLLNRWSEGDNLKVLLGQLKEMQAKAPEHPATARTTALVRLLMRQPPDLASYIRVLKGLVEADPQDKASRLALAVGLVRLADYDAATGELNKLLEQNPCDPQANELMAVTLMRQLNIDKAAEQLTQSLERYPNREALLRNLAETRLVQQDYPAAFSVLQKLLGLETNKERHPLYRSRLVSTCLQAGWHDRIPRLAEDWLKGADPKEAPAIRSYLLSADAAQGKHDQFLDRCRKWLAEDPKDQQLKQWLLGIGSVPGQADTGLIGAGRPDEAVAQATAWAAAAPNDPIAQYTLLQTLRAAHRPADVIEISRANLALAEKPQQKLAPLQILADAYLMADRYDEAIAAVKEMGNQAGQIEEADLSFQLDEMLVSYFAQAKRYGDAVAQANRIISGLDEKDTRLHQLAQDESLDAARRVQILQAQEKIREQRSQVLRSLSFIYTKQDRRDQAIECLRQARKLTPEDAGINNDLGYTMADAGMDLDEAERLLKAAVSEVLWNGVGEDDRQAAFMDSLGWLHYKRGKFTEARGWLVLGAKMEDGQDPVIHDHLGDAEWRLGHSKEAVQAWKKAIELHDRRVEEKKQDRDEKFLTSVKVKLDEAGRDGKPAVATATSD